ncbi:hypothetical protein BGZ63DRAFT_386085 [Mariannaea sp. PMI_226]|nr:hypothetical protein BGZ63DRAFT_386085 [Mariannaea sp. PMI_226]
MYTSTILTLGSLVTIASATALDNAFSRREFKFPATVPMHKRAVTGAEYQCHANCGYTILDADKEGYCDSSEWKELLQACLSCANTYNLWGDYGDGVKAAAEGCGLSAVPSGSSGPSTSAAAPTSATVETTEAASTTQSVAETTAVETTSVPEETTTAIGSTTIGSTTIISTSVVVSTTIPSTPTGSNGTISTPTTSVVQGDAPGVAVPHVVAAGAALFAIAGLM